MRAPLTAPPGGVMTDEVGAVTGDLEVWLDGQAVRAAYVGSSDTYTVTGSPVPQDVSVERVVEHLSADPGPDESGNARSTDLTALSTGGAGAADQASSS